ncbi:MAG: hypothetical protein KAT58_01335 [candidate division Zixibacteria bacterium]|nr:hypothetical protein [candidate division Zixibacteria bacterium]
MIALSESARRSLDDYLRQARAYLRGSKSVDAGEVEQNITEHIENELQGATEPVSCDVLDAVLDRLGSPRQWVSEEELPWWHRIILRLRSGPEDWRLAYMSFGLFVAALVIAPATPPLVFVVLMLAGFLASRAAISQTPDSNQLKAQKWLIYPSLIGVYGFVLVGLFTLPLVLLIPLAEEYERHFSRLQNDLDYWFTACTVFSVAFAAMGAWWGILALVTLILGKRVVVLFRPFADAYKAKWAFLLLVIGLGLMILSMGTGILYYRYFM